MEYLAKGKRMIAAIINWWNTRPVYTGDFDERIPQNLSRKEIDKLLDIREKHQGNKFTRVTMRLLGWSVVAFILFLIYRVLT